MLSLVFLDPKLVIPKNTLLVNQDKKIQPISSILLEQGKKNNCKCDNNK